MASGQILPLTRQLLWQQDVDDEMRDIDTPPSLDVETPSTHHTVNRSARDIVPILSQKFITPSEQHQSDGRDPTFKETLDPPYTQQGLGCISRTGRQSLASQFVVADTTSDVLGDTSDGRYEYYRTRVVEEESSDQGGRPRKRKVTETIGRRPVSTGPKHPLWDFFHPSLIIYISVLAALASLLFIWDVKAERLLSAKAQASEYEIEWVKNACDANPAGLEAHCQSLNELRNADAHMSGGWYTAIFTVMAKASSAPLTYLTSSLSSVLISLGSFQLVLALIALFILINLLLTLKKG